MRVFGVQVTGLVSITERGYSLDLEIGEERDSGTGKVFQ